MIHLPKTQPMIIRMENVGEDEQFSVNLPGMGLWNRKRHYWRNGNLVYEQKKVMISVPVNGIHLWEVLNAIYVRPIVVSYIFIEVFNEGEMSIEDIMLQLQTDIEITKYSVYGNVYINTIKLKFLEGQENMKCIMGVINDVEIDGFTMVTVKRLLPKLEITIFLYTK